MTESASPPIVWRFHKNSLNPPFTEAAMLKENYPGMSLARAMSLATKERNEPLQIGAMLLLHNQGRAFVIKDQAKEEMTGLMNVPVALDGDEIWCFPAGAREREETIAETIRREFREEAERELPDGINLRVINDKPYVVSQFSRVKDAAVQFGVWVVEAEVDRESDFFEGLQDLVDAGKGKWVSEEEMGGLSLPGGVVEWQRAGIRPQTIVAMMLWLGSLDEERVGEMNQSLIDHTKVIADQRKIRTVNGVFDANGGVAPESWLPVQAFLAAAD